MKRSTTLQQLIGFVLVTTGQMMSLIVFDAKDIVEERHDLVQPMFLAPRDNIQLCFLYEGQDCNCGQPFADCGRCICDLRHNLTCSPSTNKCVYFINNNGKFHAQVREVTPLPIQQKTIVNQFTITFGRSVTPPDEVISSDVSLPDPTMVEFVQPQHFPIFVVPNAQVATPPVHPNKGSVPENFRGAYIAGFNNEPLSCGLDEGDECQCGRKHFCGYCSCRLGLQCLPMLDEHTKRCQVLIPQQKPEVIVYAPAKPEFEFELPEVFPPQIVQRPDNV